MRTEITTDIKLGNYQLIYKKGSCVKGVIARAHKNGFRVINDEQIFQQIKHQLTNYDKLMEKFNNNEKQWCSFTEGRKIIVHIYQQLADVMPNRFQSAVRAHFLRVLKEFRDEICRADLYATS